MIRRDSLFGRNVAEHSFLLVIVSAHSLASLTFFTSDEFFQLKLQKKWVFQQAVNREIGLLKSMLNRAVKWGLIGAHPAKDVELFELDETSVSDRVLSNEEEPQLLGACDQSELRSRAPHLKHVVLIALYTGLRRGEILSLRWSDIDFERSRLTVRKSKTKSGKRDVYLNSMLHQELLSLSRLGHGEWVFPSPGRFQTPGQPKRHIEDVKNAFHRAVHLAGIKKITFHQLRHTFCSRLADAGVPLPVIQKLAGHASITMTSRYTHPADELKQSAVEILLKGRKGVVPATEPATEILKSPEGQNHEAANQGRSIG
jgi:integrase